MISKYLFATQVWNIETVSEEYGVSAEVIEEALDECEVSNENEM